MFAFFGKTTLCSKIFDLCDLTTTLSGMVCHP